MRAIFLVFCTWSLLTSFNQEEDYALELTHKLVKAYYTSYPLTYTFDMHQYDSSGTVFIESMKGEITACTKYYAMNYGNIEVIIEDSFMLTRNSEVKEILLKSIRPGQRDSLLNLSMNAIIERLKSQEVKVKKLKSDEKNSSYELSFDYLAEGVYIMIIDNKTGYIQQLEVKYYTGNDRFQITPYTMRIYYSNYRSTPYSSPLKNYIYFQGVQPMIKDKYKEFKVHRF